MRKRKPRYKGWVDSKPAGDAINIAIAELRKIRGKVAPEEKKKLDPVIGKLTGCLASVKVGCGRFDPWFLAPPGGLVAMRKMAMGKRARGK